MLVTDPENIKRIAAEKEEENELFRNFLTRQNPLQTDAHVHALNQKIAPQIDCTRCGNCCKSLVNVTAQEIESLSELLQVSPAELKDKYVAESQGGDMVINSMPCHFLNGTICSIYTHRFTSCRDFPYLHKPNFTRRYFSTMMYYSKCPIIFNVVEKLKGLLGFG